MRCIAEPSRSISVPRVILVTAIALGAAGCSSDTSRFNEGLFNSANASRNAPPSTQVAAADPQTSRIETQPLPQPAGAPLARPAGVATGPGIAGGGRGTASYQPASTDVTGSVVPPPAPAAHSSQGQWKWEGGTAISAAPGDTLQSIGQRHGVPAAAIAQANGLVPNAALYPGQRIVIPRYQQTGAAPQRPAPQQVATSTSARAPSGEHVVEAGDTLMKLSRLYHKPVGAIAAANNIPADARLKIGDRIVIPGAQAIARQPAPSQHSVE